jgi:hypothetical protein
VKVVSQVLDTLVGEVPVVMPPGKLFFNVTARLERLEGLDDVKVGNLLEFCIVSENNHLIPVAI